MYSRSCDYFCLSLTCIACQNVDLQTSLLSEGSASTGDLYTRWHIIIAEALYVKVWNSTSNISTSFFVGVRTTERQFFVSSISNLYATFNIPVTCLIVQSEPLVIWEEKARVIRCVFNVVDTRHDLGWLFLFAVLMAAGLLFTMVFFVRTAGPFMLMRRG